MYCIDKKKGLRVGGKIYTFGEKVPVDQLGKSRTAKFVDEGILGDHNPNQTKKKKVKKEGK